jgi:hypothetical protein
MAANDKCDICDKDAELLIFNISANDQKVCESHLPWIYNVDNLPDNVSRYPKIEKVQEEVKSESGKNSSKASASSAKQSNTGTGPISTGSTGPA